MSFVRLFLFFLLAALAASFLNVPGLEFLASDGAKWTLVVGILVLIAKAVGIGKQSS
jgi:hypothetical protein